MYPNLVDGIDQAYCTPQLCRLDNQDLLQVAQSRNEAKPFHPSRTDGLLIFSSGSGRYLSNVKDVMHVTQCSLIKERGMISFSPNSKLRSVRKGL
jgi:hypothetical protein